VAGIRVVRSVLLAAGVFSIAAGAAEPVYRIVPVDSVAERYFQREAANYLKFEQEGQTVYCTSAKTSSAALIPHIGYSRCIRESDLRRVVRDWRRTRMTTAS